MWTDYRFKKAAIGNYIRLQAFSIEASILTANLLPTHASKSQCIEFNNCSPFLGILITYSSNKSKISRQNRCRHHAVTRINLSKLEYLPGLMTLAASCGGETVTLLSLQR
ncbi:hypothetical protein T05_13423 [Trichinella murrelli]|uniref:Uncharacterized protein n=1 Tax=Trichinella murrelli TaxID=144512 RepID=A0A0V0T4A6_9BILA|nr:hypothetical protein T05_13423 [Trichinella murrelli]